MESNGHTIKEASTISYKSSGRGPLDSYASSLSGGSLSRRSGPESPERNYVRYSSTQSDTSHHSDTRLTRKIQKPMLSKVNCITKWIVWSKIVVETIHHCTNWIVGQIKACTCCCVLWEELQMPACGDWRLTKFTSTLYGS